MSKKRIISLILFLIFIAVFIFSAGFLFFYGNQYKEADDEYILLEKEFVKEDKIKDPGGEDNPPEVDLEKLKATNPDAVGWIYFPKKLGISYPIVKGEDNDYYLKHTFEKKYNMSASIFMDYRNNYDFIDPNTIIYGHNMNNGSMFAKLNKYASKAFYDENPGFYIYNERGVHYYKIFSCFKLKMDGSEQDYYKIKFSSMDEYKEFLDRVKKSSLYDTGVEVSTQNRVIMLSTCTSSDAYRFVIFAVRDQEKVN